MAQTFRSIYQTRTDASIRETNLLDAALQRANDATQVDIFHQNDDGSWTLRSFGDEKTAVWAEGVAARRGVVTRRA
jgi:hypothetical protein